MWINLQKALIDKQFGKINEAKQRLEMITNQKGIDD